MADTFKVRVDGAAALDRILQELPERVARRAVNHALMAGGAVVVAELRRTAPVGHYGASGHIPPGPRRFGPLVRNIRRATLKIAGASMTVGVGIGAAFWGMFQEFGTSRMRAHPWFRKGWESSRMPALEAIGKDLGQSVEREASILAGEYPTRRGRG